MLKLKAIEKVHYIMGPRCKENNIHFVSIVTLQMCNNFGDNFVYLYIKRGLVVQCYRLVNEMLRIQLEWGIKHLQC